MPFLPEQRDAHPSWLRILWLEKMAWSRPENRILESVGCREKWDGFQGSPVIFHYIYISIYTLWLFNIAMERSTMFKNGKPSINEPFSMAMLNNQRVYSVYSIRTILHVVSEDSSWCFILGPVILKNTSDI